MIFILDAAALLNNPDFAFNSSDTYFTTNLVFAEWKDFVSKSLASSASSSGALKVRDPSPASLSAAKKIASDSGTRLSDADLSVAGLAQEFLSEKKDFVVLTDDYSLQNVLKKAGAHFQGIIHPEIKKHKKFALKNNFKFNSK